MTHGTWPDASLHHSTTPPLRLSFRAVIFDMDGVVVDSEPRHERAFLEVVREIGYGETQGIRVADYIGRSDRELWMEFIARHHRQSIVRPRGERFNPRVDGKSPLEARRQDVAEVIAIVYGRASLLKIEHRRRFRREVEPAVVDRAGPEQA